MKRKRTKPVQTREEQAAAEGWVYVSTSKAIHGWNSIWVEGSRAQAQGDVEEKGQRQ
jgi:hypothetical protein